MAIFAKLFLFFTILTFPWIALALALVMFWVKFQSRQVEFGFWAAILHSSLLGVITLLWGIMFLTSTENQRYWMPLLVLFGAWFLGGVAAAISRQGIGRILLVSAHVALPLAVMIRSRPWKVEDIGLGVISWMLAAPLASILLLTDPEIGERYFDGGSPEA